MALERRLARLEAQRGMKPDTTARDAAAFVDHLDRLAAQITGDAEHRAEASPAENYVRALARGDARAAEEILVNAAQGYTVASLRAKHG